MGDNVLFQLTSLFSDHFSNSQKLVWESISYFVSGYLLTFLNEFQETIIEVNFIILKLLFHFCS